MNVSDIMSKNLLTLESNDTLQKAKSIFDTTKIHQILIIENNELIGVISARDVFKQLGPNVGTRKETPSDVSALNRKVHLFMNRELVMTEKHTSINEAILLFHDNNISCLPIVDQSKKPIGIVSWRDIIRVIALRYKQKLTTEQY